MTLVSKAGNVPATSAMQLWNGCVPWCCYLIELDLHVGDAVVQDATYLLGVQCEGIDFGM